MGESGLQHWLQGRLLQLVEPNLAAHDLQRWGQWWQEKEGQAFWQTCEWLWQTLGPRAIYALLLSIKTTLVETELYRWVQRWQRGDSGACRHAWEWLWKELSPEVIRYACAIAKQDAYDLAAKAFDAAFEELDLKVSRGKLLTKPADGINWDKRTDIPKEVITLGTARELGMPKPFKWLGADSFKALFRHM
jgi:hypothetical protein